MTKGLGSLDTKEVKVAEEIQLEPKEDITEVEDTIEEDTVKDTIITEDSNMTWNDIQRTRFEAMHKLREPEVKKKEEVVTEEIKPVTADTKIQYYKHCTECGTKIVNAESLYCPNCGFNLSNKS